MAIATSPTASATTAVSSSELGSSLAKFIAGLFTDFNKFQAFEANSELEMDKADLTSKEKGYLTHQNFKNICDHIGAAGPAPVPTGDDSGGNR